MPRRGSIKILPVRCGGRSARGRSRRVAPRWLVAALLLLAPVACRVDADRRIAERILERYRRSSGAKPLPASHVIRMRLASEAAGAGTGVAEVAWEPNRFRELISSAGATTERGIQAGKAYFTDEDGVTRVVSEPVLRELLSRSYFWRRGWLFADRERARLSLGPSDSGSVSVRLWPLGGNPLLLSFSRHDGRLLAVRSPRFDLDFTDPRAFREATGRLPPVLAEIVWIGLPTGRLPDAAVGGGCGRFAPVAALVPFERTPDGGVVFAAEVNGRPVRLSLDAAADGPLAISAEKARELSLSATNDVYGRPIASGVTLEVGGFSCPGIHLQTIPAAPAGSDGVVGGTLYREGVLELDPKAAGLSLHDPSRWVAPAGFNRMLLDDDGNRPTVTLRRKSEEARLAAGSPVGKSDLRLAEGAAARLGVEVPGPVSGLRWSILELPPLQAAYETGPASPDWGDDGRLGIGFLLRFRTFVDLPHRWIYLRGSEPKGR